MTGKKVRFWTRSTESPKSKNLVPGVFLKIDYELFWVIGLKYDIKSPPDFSFLIFSSLPFIVPRYYYAQDSALHCAPYTYLGT